MGQTDQPTDRQTDGLQELLEWPLATKKIYSVLRSRRISKLDRRSFSSAHVCIYMEVPKKDKNKKFLNYVDILTPLRVGETKIKVELFLSVNNNKKVELQ